MAASAAPTRVEASRASPHACSQAAELVSRSLYEAVSRETTLEARQSCVGRCCNNMVPLVLSDEVDSGSIIAGLLVCQGLVDLKAFDEERGVQYCCLGGLSGLMYAQAFLECMPCAVCAYCTSLEPTYDSYDSFTCSRPCSEEDEHECEFGGSWTVALTYGMYGFVGMTLVPLALIGPLLVVAAKPVQSHSTDIQRGCVATRDVLVESCKRRSCTLCAASCHECTVTCGQGLGNKIAAAFSACSPSSIAAACSHTSRTCINNIPCRTQCIRCLHSHEYSKAIGEIKSEDVRDSLRRSPVEWLKWQEESSTLSIRMTPNTPLQLRLGSKIPKLRVVSSDLLILVEQVRLSTEDLKLPVQLPSGIQVEGDMAFASVPALDAGEMDNNKEGLSSLLIMPDDLKIRGCLFLYNVQVLRWGSKMKLGSLCVIDTDGLIENLPNDLIVDGQVFLQECTQLRSLPDWTSTGSLNLHTCISLASLPETLSLIQGDLILDGCSSLVSLPDNLTVDGSLFLRGCVSLQCLPRNLTVNGDLIATDCTELRYISDSLVLRGNLLDFSNCVNLFSLPITPLEAPRSERLLINLQNTSLVGSQLDALRSIGAAANVTIFLGNESELLRQLGANNESDGEVKLSSLFDVAREFNIQASDLEPYIDPAYLRGVLQFLSMLLSSQEYKDEKIRPDLKNRVHEVLQLIMTDPVARQELVLRMLDAVDACADKPIWALGQMQVVAAVAHARGDRAKLRKLGRGIMRLSVVHEHVNRFINEQERDVDDVCVYLRFEIELRDALDLPVSSKAMIYARHVPIPAPVILAAKRDALAIGEKRFEAWLATWPEWQRQERMEAVVPYLDLQRHETLLFELPNVDPTDLTDLKGEPMTDPVFLLPDHSNVWSYNDLCERWVSTGLDFNNMAVSKEDFFSHLHRLLDTKPTTLETPQRASLGRRESLRRQRRVSTSLAQSKVAVIPEEIEEDSDDEEEATSGVGVREGSFIQRLRRSRKRQESRMQPHFKEDILHNNEADLDLEVAAQEDSIEAARTFEQNNNSRQSSSRHSSSRTFKTNNMVSPSHDVYMKRISSSTPQFMTRGSVERRPEGSRRVSQQHPRVSSSRYPIRFSASTNTAPIPENDFER